MGIIFSRVLKQSQDYVIFSSRLLLLGNPHTPKKKKLTPRLWRPACPSMVGMPSPGSSKEGSTVASQWTGLRGDDKAMTMRYGKKEIAGRI